jgi:hypothetical protein
MLDDPSSSVAAVSALVKKRRANVGHGAMTFAVRPLDNWVAAEAKIRVRGITIWPPAGIWDKRGDLFGGRQVEGLFRHRLDEEGSGRPRLGASVCPGLDRDGLLDLGNRHRPRRQETKHDRDAARDGTIAGSPTPHASRADAE